MCESDESLCRVCGKGMAWAGENDFPDKEWVCPTCLLKENRKLRERLKAVRGIVETPMPVDALPSEHYGELITRILEVLGDE